MAVVTVDQNLPVNVVFTDRAGNPALVDGAPTWESSDESVVEILEVSDDGLSVLVGTVGVGTAQVVVRADARLGDDVKEIVGVLDVEVLAGEAFVVQVLAGAAEPKE